jgi:uncharacterized coiled-coil protein SlyX
VTAPLEERVAALEDAARRLAAALDELRQEVNRQAARLAVHEDDEHREHP